MGHIAGDEGRVDPLSPRPPPVEFRCIHDHFRVAPRRTVDEEGVRKVGVDPWTWGSISFYTRCYSSEILLTPHIIL